MKWLIAFLLIVAPALLFADAIWNGLARFLAWSAGN